MNTMYNNELSKRTQRLYNTCSVYGDKVKLNLKSDAADLYAEYKAAVRRGMAEDGEFIEWAEEQYKYVDYNLEDDRVASQIANKISLKCYLEIKEEVENYGVSYYDDIIFDEEVYYINYYINLMFHDYIKYNY